MGAGDVAARVGDSLSDMAYWVWNRMQVYAITPASIEWSISLRGPKPAIQSLYTGKVYIQSLQCIIQGRIIHKLSYRCYCTGLYMVFVTGSIIRELWYSLSFM